MKSIENHVEGVLKDFEEIKILQEVLFVGAWARYFYKEYFTPEVGYYPRLATKDLDILLRKKSLNDPLHTDLHQKLLDSGYSHQIFRNALVKYYKHELELEFLLPTHGSKKIVSVKAYNVKAQQLPYLEMLWAEPVKITYGNYTVLVPDPFHYAIHKLIIASSRSKKETKLQDIRDAEEVLAALEKGEIFDKSLSEVCKTYSKIMKTKSKILKSLPSLLDPNLRESLINHLDEKKM